MAGWLLVLAGCGGERRYELTGTVTYGGQPVERGEISFDPTEPGEAPEGGPILDGRFRVEVGPGKKIVRIRGSRPLPPEQQDSPEMGLLYEDYIPARHNTESTREVEITPGGQREFTFDLRTFP